MLQLCKRINHSCSSYVPSFLLTKFSDVRDSIITFPTMSELELISKYCKTNFAAPLGWYWSCEYRENDDRFIQTFNFEHGVSDFVPPRESMGVEPYRLNVIFVKDI